MNRLCKDEHWLIPYCIAQTGQSKRLSGKPQVVGRKRLKAKELCQMCVRLTGIVPNRPSTDLTLCAAKRRRFGASAGRKT